MGRQTRVLAVASGGGHWVQLQRVMRAFEGATIVYVTTNAGYGARIRGAGFHVVRDANRWDRWGAVVLCLQMLRIVLAERPQVVFSTGAAPGAFAILFGRLLGARTIWLDSLANVDRISLSGRLIRPFAGLFLTQWPQLAEPGRYEYAGAVL